MTTTDDDTRLGLGWEVWVILVVFAGFGALGPFLVGLIGGVVVSEPAVTVAITPVPLDPSRVVAGIGAATVFALAAVGIIRTTDWHIPD